MKFFIDECLSRRLARMLNDRGLDAFHPLDIGRRGESDRMVLRRCIEEDRIIVTSNARDFRGLMGKQELHPGLVILPSVDREASWLLLEKVLAELRREPDACDYMVNRVIDTRFERCRPIRLWQPRREGERNEALNTTVYAMAALHGLISMGLRLNEEADVLGAAPAKGSPAPSRPAEPPRVIRSRWMN